MRLSFSLFIVRPELIEATNTGRRIMQRPQSLDMGGTLGNSVEDVPQSQKIVFVTGTASGDRRTEHEARIIFKPWSDKLEFQYTGDLLCEEILQLVSTSPPRSIVLYRLMSFQTRPAGPSSPGRSGKWSPRPPTRPVFCLWDTLIGSGVIGGSLLSFEAEGTYAGKCGT